MAMTRRDNTESMGLKSRDQFFGDVIWMETDIDGMILFRQFLKTLRNIPNRDAWPRLTTSVGHKKHASFPFQPGSFCFIMPDDIVERVRGYEDTLSTAQYALKMNPVRLIVDENGGY